MEYIQEIKVLQELTNKTPFQRKQVKQEKEKTNQIIFKGADEDKSCSSLKIRMKLRANVRNRSSQLMCHVAQNETVKMLVSSTDSKYFCLNTNSINHIRQSSFALQQKAQKSIFSIKISSVEQKKRKLGASDECLKKREQIVEKLDYDLLSDLESEDQLSEYNESYFQEQQKEQIQQKPGTKINMNQVTDDSESSSLSSDNFNSDLPFDQSSKQRTKQIDPFTAVESFKFINKQFDYSQDQESQEADSSLQQFKIGLSGFNTNQIDFNIIQNSCKITPFIDEGFSHFQIHLNKQSQDLFKLNIHDNGSRAENGSFDIAFGRNSSDYQLINNQDQKENYISDYDYEENQYKRVMNNWNIVNYRSEVYRQFKNQVKIHQKYKTQKRKSKLKKVPKLQPDFRNLVAIQEGIKQSKLIQDQYKSEPCSPLSKNHFN